MDRSIAVVGLGYVGLPLAVAFGKKAPVIGFDISRRRIEELRRREDRTREVSAADLAEAQVEYTTDPAALKRSDFIIVTVPTPVDDAKQPDLSCLLSASEIVGGQLRPGAIVVFESTVYPGVTEDVCVPALERASGLACGRDFKVGYSPERINPGDREHTLERVVKVVAGMDAETLETVARVYGAVAGRGVFKAASIKTAEAAKVIENTQRDLNIALMNELAMIFHRMGLDTAQVLEAAATKWNFLSFKPGLVGGHCISVDPYYLTQKAERLGYHPQVILAGRRINDGMAKYVAEQTVKLLVSQERQRAAGARGRAGDHVQGERAGHPQLEGRGPRPRAFRVWPDLPGPRSAGFRRGDAAGIRARAVPGIGHRRVRRRHPGGASQGLSRKGRRLGPLAAAPPVAVCGD